MSQNSFIHNPQFVQKLAYFNLPRYTKIHTPVWINTHLQLRYLC